MADSIPINQSSPNVVRIDSVNLSLLKTLGPVINVGDVIKLLVRQNQPGAQGLLAYQGNLIPANLPEFLQSGDKIAAKVLQQGEQIVFKIIDHQKNTQSPIEKYGEQITKQLKTLFATLSANQTQIQPEPLQAADLSKIIVNDKALQSMVDNVASKIPNTEVLTDGKSTSSFLHAASTGTMAQNLKVVAQSLRELIAQYSPSNAQKFLDLIRTQLLQLEDPLVKEQTSTFKMLNQLTDALKKEINPTLDPKSKDNTLLGSIIKELASAQASPDSIRNIMESIAGRLAQLPENAKILDPKTLNDLKNLANRLDGLAQTQETLAQLNPLMNALGEPALILFPFLFQGLLNHSKIYIEAEDLVQRKNKDGKQGSEDGSEGAYQRIQVTVPLPTLGNVDVDIAHRSKEILVRFTVNDQEVGTFILEQLENLAAILKEQGFDQAELVANVNKNRSATSHGNVSITSSTSIIV